MFLNEAIKDFLKNPAVLSFESLSLPFLSSSPVPVPVAARSGSLDLTRKSRGMFEDDASSSLLGLRFFLGVSMALEGRLEESLALAGVVVVDESEESRRMVLVASEILTLRRSLIGRGRFSDGLAPVNDDAKLTPVGERALDDEVLIPPCSQCTAFVAST